MIKKEEIKKLIDLLKKNKESNNPLGFIYSKAFMSFSQCSDVALNFMNLRKPTEKEVRVLYIIETEVEYDEKTNYVDLKDISFFEDEEEILIFPFSYYEIRDIQKENNYYKIILNNLAIYRMLNFKNTDLIKSIYQSKIVKRLLDNDLLKLIVDLKDIPILLHFLSMDHAIYFSLFCKITDYFSKIEEMLCSLCPEFRKKTRKIFGKEYLVFLVNGKMINRSRTLWENGIKDENVILICEFEFY